MPEPLEYCRETELERVKLETTFWCSTINASPPSQGDTHSNMLYIYDMFVASRITGAWSMRTQLKQGFNLQRKNEMSRSEKLFGNLHVLNNITLQSCSAYLYILILFIAQYEG